MFTFTRRLVALVALALVLLPNTTSARSQTAGRYSARTASSPLQQVVALANIERRRAGLAPLHISYRLTIIAQQYSQVEARAATMSHTGPDGSDPGERLDRSGYDWGTFGENLAGGFATSNAVMVAWMQSPHHRANILNPAVEEIGVGLTHRSNDPSSYFDYWVMELGTLR
ncbi:MAG: hypothetical protein NVS4B8_29390 [Herpetosiphon sp.]